MNAHSQSLNVHGRSIVPCFYCCCCCCWWWWCCFAQLSALQRDSNTYCKPPSDACAFKIWTDNFDMRSKADEISALLSGNPFMQELYSRIVPYVVDKNVFWTRYFFHVSKLHEAQQLRMHLVQKAIKSTEAEELDAWEDEGGELCVCLCFFRVVLCIALAFLALGRAWPRPPRRRRRWRG